MINEGRIPHNEAEAAAVVKLEGEHPGESMGLTRRDPGETGPLLVTIGVNTWEIAEEGKRKKVS